MKQLISLLVLMLVFTSCIDRDAENLPYYPGVEVERTDAKQMAQELYVSSNPTVALERRNNNGNTKGGGKKNKSIIFASDDTSILNRAIDSIALQPYELYPSGSSFDTFDPFSATFNGSTYERIIHNYTTYATVHLYKDGTPIYDGGVTWIRNVNVNGTDHLYWSTYTDLRDENGDIVLTWDTDFTDTIQPTFGVVDVDHNGQDDLVVSYNGWDDRRTQVIWDFINTPDDRTNVLYYQRNQWILGFIDDGSTVEVVTRGIPVDDVWYDPYCCDYYSKATFTPDTPLPISHVDLVSNFTLVQTTANPDFIEFPDLPPYLGFNVRFFDENGGFLPDISGQTVVYQDHGWYIGNSNLTNGTTYQLDFYKLGVQLYFTYSPN